MFQRRITPSNALNASLHTIATTFGKRLTMAPKALEAGGKWYWKSLSEIGWANYRKELGARLHADRMRSHYEQQMKIARSRVSELHEVFDQSHLTPEEKFAELQAIYAEQVSIMKEDEI